MSEENKKFLEKYKAHKETKMKTDKTYAKKQKAKAVKLSGGMGIRSKREK